MSSGAMQNKSSKGMGTMEGFLPLTLFEELELTGGWVLWHLPHWLSLIFPVLIGNRHENILLSLFPVVFIWNPAGSFQSSAHFVGILGWSWPPDLSFSCDWGKKSDILLHASLGCVCCFPLHFLHLPDTAFAETEGADCGGVCRDWVFPTWRGEASGRQ